MDETKSLSETEGTQPPVEGSSGSSQTSTIAQRRSGVTRSSDSWARAGSDRVYLAHDDDLDRPVAIKVPTPRTSLQPEDIEAYLNEARILASLDHPHIVPVYDVGRTDDGLCFVVSKLIEGSDLANRIKESSPRLSRVGGTGGDGRRSPSLRPHPGIGPPGHQARQHPDRRFGKRLRGRLRSCTQG